MSDFKLAQTHIQTHYGPFGFSCFSYGEHEEDNILCLDKGPFGEFPLVRVQSACYTAEIFRSKDCDCHEQLEKSLQLIQEQGGLLVYMLCDGRGAGLYQKVLGLELGRTAGLDTSDAYHRLGLEQDPRTYSRVADVLKYFGVERVRLLTNNPRKVEGLISSGITAERSPLEIQATIDSAPYLETKAKKMGHLFSQFGRTSPVERGDQ